MKAGSVCFTYERGFFFNLGKVSILWNSTQSVSGMGTTPKKFRRPKRLKRRKEGQTRKPRINPQK